MMTATTRGTKESPVIAEVIGTDKMTAGESGIIAAKTGSGKGFFNACPVFASQNGFTMGPVKKG